MKPKNSPPSKGQGTLFSFFSKKETPPTSREDARDTKPKQESGNRTPLRDARTSPKQLTQDSEELVGKRLKVFWRDDNNWYYGRVVSFSGEDGKHLVHYDDGDKEKLVLAEEKVCGRPSTRPPSALQSRGDIREILRCEGVNVRYAQVARARAGSTPYLVSHRDSVPNIARVAPSPFSHRHVRMYPKKSVLFDVSQFELAPEKPAQAAKKNRARVIKDDDDEAEWNKDQLEDSMVDDRSSYQVHERFASRLQLRLPVGIFKCLKT